MTHRPQIRTALVGAALIAAAISLDDFIIASFTLGGGNTLSTFVWGQMRTTLDPSINAIATILLAFDRRHVRAGAAADALSRLKERAGVDAGPRCSAALWRSGRGHVIIPRRTEPFRYRPHALGQNLRTTEFSVAIPLLADGWEADSVFGD